MGLCQVNKKRASELTQQPFKNGEYVCWGVNCVDIFSQISANKSIEAQINEIKQNINELIQLPAPVNWVASAV